MKKQFRKTFAMLCAITVMASSVSVFGASASEPPVESDYTLTIPATLAVENSGWNSIGDLTATGTLAQGKKLNVTAASENSWNLTSGENTVAYKLCGETEKTKTYADAAATTSLDISKELLEQTDGFSVPIGIVVEDYSTKPAGDYSDTVTFTASVEDAKPEYYDKLTKINDNFSDQVYKLKMLGRGRESYNSSLTAAQAWELAKYQAAIDNVTVYVIMSSQDDGYEIHYSVSTDAAATEHTSDLYDICNESNPVRMYYITVYHKKYHLSKLSSRKAPYPETFWR